MPLLIGIKTSRLETRQRQGVYRCSAWIERLWERTTPRVEAENLGEGDGKMSEAPALPPKLISCKLFYVFDLCHQQNRIIMK